MYEQLFEKILEIDLAVHVGKTDFTFSLIRMAITFEYLVIYFEETHHSFIIDTQLMHCNSYVQTA